MTSRYTWSKPTSVVLTAVLTEMFMLSAQLLPKLVRRPPHLGRLDWTAVATGRDNNDDVATRQPPAGVPERFAYVAFGPVAIYRASQHSLWGDDSKPRDAHSILSGDEA